jgi:hypothetical protein
MPATMKVARRTRGPASENLQSDIERTLELKEAAN